MPRYALGTTVRVGSPPLQVRDSTGALADATAISLTVQKPDASTQLYSSLTHDGTGLYHQDLPITDLTQLGHYSWYASVTVGTFSFVLPSGSFDVFDPLEPLLLPLQDAKDALNIAQSVTSNDAEIMRKLATIEAGIERVTGGPIINRTISNERLKVGSGFRTMALRYRPLVSVTSIVDVASSATLPINDLDPDLTIGILRRKLDLPFWSRGPYYLVTYVAGWGTSVPPAIADAATDILKHQWEMQRSGVALPRFGPEQTTVLPGMGYAIPNAAAEKLAPFALEAYV